MDEQIDLLAIAPSGESKSEVRGLSLRTITGLLRRFPELASLASGGSVNASRLMETVPDACVAIMASGIPRAAGNAKAEAELDSLPAHRQVSILTEVMKKTFPEGFGSFIDLLSSFLAPKGAAETTSQADDAGELLRDPLSNTSPSPSSS